MAGLILGVALLIAAYWAPQVSGGLCSCPAQIAGQPSSCSCGYSPLFVPFITAGFVAVVFSADGILISFLRRTTPKEGKN